MTALYYLVGVVVFFTAILVSIGLHEIGHLVPAKAFGTKVTQYFVGFGKTVWSTRRGETEYGVKAIPLGGFVKIVGMLPPAGHDAEPEHDASGALLVRKSNTGMFTQLISDARAAEYEHVRPEDSERLFYKLPWWKKVIVMAGGPTVNVLIAFVIFTGVFATVGNPADAVVHTTVGIVEDCVIPADRTDQICRPGDPVSPAKKAGLRHGDDIVSFNGTDVTSWTQLQGLIRGNADGSATIGVRRDGQLLTLHTNTLVSARPTDEADPTKLTPVGFLGVSPVQTLQHGGPLYTLEQMGSMTVTTAHALVTLPVKVWGVAEAIVGVKERAADSPVSIVGGGRLAGEAASDARFPLKDKIVDLLMLIAGFNLFVGLFNFVPLLPLDGGHIAGALWEACRRGWARLRRRPDPGFVDVARMLPVAYGVAGLLLVMGVVLIVGDLVVPVHLS